MIRREFFALAGGAMVWPAAARAQRSGKVFRIGFLGIGTRPKDAEDHKAFLTELRQLGFGEGENLVVEHRSVQDPRGPSAMAAELARVNVDLFVAYGPEAALQAVIGVGGAVPIVILAVNYDPIERGYAASLARPGGNITGVFTRQPELAAKQLELLSLAFPGRARVGVLWDAISADQFAMAEKAAKSMRLELRPLKLENPPYDFDGALRKLAADGAQTLLVLSSPFFRDPRPSLAEIALRHRLPTMFSFRSYVREGGLMSYGVDTTPLHRRVAVYAAKILNGAKPADLPVEQPAIFKLVVNLQTAKALGVTLPESILVRADEVID